MNEALVSNWNERVSEEDIVFHVGDFCFRNSAGGKAGEGAIHKANHYKRILNGEKVFIRGNHDKNNSLKTIIESLIIKYGHNVITLVHNPEHYSSTTPINFVGHIHEKWRFKRVYNNVTPNGIDLINVGVDVWNFKPVTFEEIYREYKVWTKNTKNSKDV